MGRKGDAYDNALCEAFFATLKLSTAFFNSPKAADAFSPISAV
jgi:transposase InsO family protein